MLHNSWGPHLTTARLWPTSFFMVTAEPFPHRLGTCKASLYRWGHLSSFAHPCCVGQHSYQSIWSTLRPMSHLQFYRAILSHECATLLRNKVADSATVELHAATLLRKQTRLLRHFSCFTILRPKWWNCSISKISEQFNLSYAFVLDAKTTLLAWTVMLVWFVYATVAACKCTVACYDFIMR